MLNLLIVVPITFLSFLSQISREECTLALHYVSPDKWKTEHARELELSEHKAGPGWRLSISTLLGPIAHHVMRSPRMRWVDPEIRFGVIVKLVHYEVNSILQGAILKKKADVFK